MLIHRGAQTTSGIGFEACQPQKGYRKAGGCSECEQKQLLQDRQVGTASGEFQQQLMCRYLQGCEWQAKSNQICQLKVVAVFCRIPSNTLFKSLERFLLGSVQRLLLTYTLALARAQLQNWHWALLSQASGRDLELALPFLCSFGHQQSPAEAVRHSGRQQRPAWASAKPNKSPVLLHREAGLHMGLAKLGKSPGMLWKAA